MVGRKYKIEYEFTDAEYAQYESWCKKYGLDGYHGAIGGSTCFEILPTSIGDFVTVYATIVEKDENGNVIFDENEKPKKRRISLDLRTP